MANLLNVLPVTKYRDQILSNLLVSAQLIRPNLKKFDVFYDYTIKDGERADTIAHDYYDESKMDWLIYITNNIYDPYYGWPLSNRQLVDFIIKKYGGLAEATQNVHHYSYTPVAGVNSLDVVNRTYNMTKTTFDNLSDTDRAGWNPVSFYEYEENENEKKRNITLISNQFIGQINEELLKLFN